MLTVKDPSKGEKKNLHMEKEENLIKTAVLEKFMTSIRKKKKSFTNTPKDIFL